MREIKPKAELLNYSDNSENNVAISAKLTHSDKHPRELDEAMKKEKKKKLVRHMIDLGHDSTLEHTHFFFHIQCSRATANQIVRHRVGTAFCLSGDTKIYSDSNDKYRRSFTLKHLYETGSHGYRQVNIRCADEENHILTNSQIKEVTKSGKKKLYKVTTKDGYSIKSTLDHRFLTKDGWKRLGEVDAGDEIYTNGEPLYRDKEWLKQKYNKDGLSQKRIGKLCNCSHHTIRKWVRKFGLQKEMGSWTIGVEPHNKGKTKDNYEPLQRTSRALSGENSINYNKSEKFRESKNPNWKGDNVTISGSRLRVNRNFKRRYKCEVCGKEGGTEIHHIDGSPKNNNSNNLIELCSTCHYVKHHGVTVRQIRLSKVETIEYVGEEMTYDIEMEEPHHNFVANGFIVHNSQRSQRYVDEGEFEYIIPPSLKEHSSYFKNRMKQLSEDYKAMRALGIPKEDARFLLPNIATHMTVSFNARSLRHFFDLRLDETAQWEVQDIAEQALEQVKEVTPNLFYDF